MMSLIWLAFFLTGCILVGLLACGLVDAAGTIEEARRMVDGDDGLDDPW